MYVKLGETIRGVFGTASFSTGAATNADVLPAFTVLDQGTALGYAPVVAVKAVGLYEVVLVASTGNGFTVGHEYSGYVTVTVGGVTASAAVSGVSSFKVMARNTDDLAFGINAAAIVNAILDELLAGHAIVGSVGDAIAIAAGLLQGNFFMDNTNNTDPNGQTSARLRVFRTDVAAASATPGGSGQGEFATFLVTTTYAGVNKVTTHRTVRQ